MKRQKSGVRKLRSGEIKSLILLGFIAVWLGVVRFLERW